MALAFTAHARARMAERGITEVQVREVLGHPAQTVAASDGREEVRGMMEREGRRMLLRVIVKRSVVVTVITVIATTKLAKYGGA